MIYTALGRSGPTISRFTLGCCFFGSEISETDSRRLRDHALDAGVNALDTVESYGPPPGASEAFLGRHLKGRRERVVVSTKVGPTRSWLDDPAEQGLTRSVITRVVEASLRRLQTDYIDILYAHFPCPATALDESLRVFDGLIRSGKVRAIGLSNNAASQVVEALWIAEQNGYAPLAATQDLYNLFERVNEWDLYPVCQRHSLGVVAYAVLAGGLLSGNYTLDMVRDPAQIPSRRRAAYYGRRHDDSAPTRCARLNSARRQRRRRLHAQFRASSTRPYWRRRMWPPGRPTIFRTSWHVAAAQPGAREGGADGVELHAHQHHLLSQFLSPACNHRDDAYGGSFGNRARLLVDALAAIRQAVGDDFAVGVRLKAHDMHAEGHDEADCIRLIELLKTKRLIDYVSLTVGGLHHHTGSLYMAEAAQLQRVAQVRRAIDLPVIHAGGIVTPAVAEGCLDVVGITKGHFADPHFVNKLRAGRREEIRVCIRCQFCCDGGEGPVGCIYNPVTGREKDWATPAPALVKRRVVVVGAGPAGMEAAITATARGHTVIVLEKAERICEDRELLSESGRPRSFRTAIGHRGNAGGDPGAEAGRGDRGDRFDANPAAYRRLRR